MSKRRRESRALRRVRKRALSIVDDAVSCCGRRDEALPAASVHDLRVTCKRLRSVWQLFTPSLGRRRTRGPEHALRDAARSLAGQREMVVVRKTLERLRRRHARDDPDPGAIVSEHEALGRAIEVLCVAPGQVATAGGEAPLVAMFEAQRKALRRWPRGLDDAVVRAGLLASYAEARQAGRRAALLDDDACWHRCRRWAKYELYQLEFLARADARTPRLRQLRRMGETLGRFNDLCTLSELALAHGHELDDCGAREGLQVVLGRERRVLRAELERGFVRLYAPSMKRRRKDIEEWLEGMGC